MPQEWWKWKQEYRNKGGVAQYDQRRFHSWQGRIKNRRDWKALERALARVPQRARLLNLPCGTGRFLPELSGQCERMVAVDISQEMVDYAREHYGDFEGRVTYARFDAERLPCRDDTFDCAVVVRFMHLINDEDTVVRLLQELARVTRHRLVVTFHHKYTLKLALERLRGKHRKGKISRAELNRMVERAGLEIERIFPTGYPFSSNWVVLLKV